MSTTFKPLVYKDTKKKDGTYNVKVRVTHNRKNTKVATNIYVTTEDLTRDTLKIKNRFILDMTDELIKRWRGYMAELGMGAEYLELKQVVDYIKIKEQKEYNKNNSFKLDFLEYGRKVAAKKAPGTRLAYITAIAALERFTNGKILDVNDITTSFLVEFETHLSKEPVYRYSSTRGKVKTDKSKANGRAVSLYLSRIKHIFNEAKIEYNDEDIGIINIPRSPFTRYKIKKLPRRKVRAIEPELIQQIINLPDLKRTVGPVGAFTRRDLARDLFILSFALAGMNAADLYDCPAQSFKKGEKVIVYNRRKTRTRREDEAEMHIRVEPCIWPLLEKYKDPTGKRLFCFYKHYYSHTSLDYGLSTGISQIVKALKSEHFTFYSARHTWATVARSHVLNIDKYTVHEGLNHTDTEMKMTDIYAKRDYRNIWEANAKVLTLFDWSAIEKQELNKKQYQK